jgi:hypothetical protein
MPDNGKVIKLQAKKLQNYNILHLCIAVCGAVEMGFLLLECGSLGNDAGISLIGTERAKVKDRGTA